MQQGRAGFTDKSRVRVGDGKLLGGTSRLGPHRILAEGSKDLDTEGSLRRRRGPANVWQGGRLCQEAGRAGVPCPRGAVSIEQSVHSDSSQGGEPRAHTGVGDALLEKASCHWPWGQSCCPMPPRGVLPGMAVLARSCLRLTGFIHRVVNSTIPPGASPPGSAGSSALPSSQGSSWAVRCGGTQTSSTSQARASTNLRPPTLLLSTLPGVLQGHCALCMQTGSDVECVEPAEEKTKAQDACSCRSQTSTLKSRRAYRRRYPTRTLRVARRMCNVDSSWFLEPKLTIQPFFRNLSQKAIPAFLNKPQTTVHKPECKAKACQSRAQGTGHLLPGTPYGGLYCLSKMRGVILLGHGLTLAGPSSPLAKEQASPSPLFMCFLSCWPFFGHKEGKCSFRRPRFLL